MMIISQRRNFLQILAGFLMLTFGIYCFIRPDLAVFTLSRLFAFLLFMFGLVSVSSAYNQRAFHQRWYLPAAEGLVYCALAGVLLLSPASILLFTRVLGLWGILVGLFRFISASLQPTAMGFSTFGGMTSFLFGLILFVYPQIIAGAISVVIGLILIILGLVLLSGGAYLWRFK